MSKLVLLAAVLAGGCTTKDHYPIIGGTGDDTMVGGHADGSVADSSSDALAMLTSRVCLLSDSRDLTSCATTGAGGLTVTLGVSTATTAADGSFTIRQPPGSNLVWHVTGPALQTTVMSFDGATPIPALTQAHYGTLLLAVTSSATLDPNTGSIFAHVVHASGATSGMAVVGATITTTSNPNAVAEYDATGTGDDWNQGATGGTGSFGMVWLPAMPAPSTTASMTVKSGTTTLPVAGLTVEDQAITYLVIAI